MRYIITQNGDKCINCYHISTFLVKELSVYARMKDQKIRLGTFNTKEDAKTEFERILHELEFKKPYIYRVSSEKDMISKRVMEEVNDLFAKEKDIATKDYIAKVDLAEDEDFFVDEAIDIDNSFDDDYDNENITND